MQLEHLVIVSVNMKILGLILAGGKSSRMGQDKALLQINNQTLLARMFKLLGSTDIDEIAISRNVSTEVLVEELKLSTNMLKMPLHTSDIIPEKGPLSGIHAAMHTFPDYHVLVIPVDLVMINIESINFLIEQFKTVNANVCFSETNESVKRTSKPNFHFPIVILNNSDSRACIDTILKHGQGYSVHGFLSEFPLANLPVKNMAELANVNKPEQWLQIKHKLL